MKAVKILLVFGIILSFSNIEIESIYNKFFDYGDRDPRDGQITLKEAKKNPNLAFKMEFERLWEKIPQKMKERGYVTKEDLRDMSIPGGIN